MVLLNEALNRLLVFNLSYVLQIATTHVSTWWDSRSIELGWLHQQLLACVPDYLSTIVPPQELLTWSLEFEDVTATTRSRYLI